MLAAFLPMQTLLGLVCWCRLLISALEDIFEKIILL
jgi:hypothetical protein